MVLEGVEVGGGGGRCSVWEGRWLVLMGGGDRLGRGVGGIRRIRRLGGVSGEGEGRGGQEEGIGGEGEGSWLIEVRQ